MKNWSPLLLTLLFSGTLAYNLSPIVSQSATASSRMTAPKSDTDLEKRAIELINAFQRKDYAQVHSFLAEPLRDYWTPKKIGNFWQGKILPEQGDIVKVISQKQENIVNGFLVILRIQFTKSISNVTIIFNKQGELVGYDFPRTGNIEDIAKSFVEDVFQGKYASARYFLHPYLKVEIFPEKIKKKTQVAQARLGSFQKVLSVDVQPLNADQDLAIVKVQFEKAAHDILVTFDKQKNIVGVDSPQN